MLKAVIKKISIQTKTRSELVDITAMVETAVKESAVRSGVCQVFVPHTTAGVTINENADPSVREDILNGLEKLAPYGAGYSHAEGNADAHIKSTIVGSDKIIFIEDGRLQFGTWQGIYFCEFDGPRQRRVFIKIKEG